MDGNRRWAKAKGLPTFEGHRRGHQRLKELVSWAKEAGIACVIVYAFSTENWNRSKEEVSYLMKLFRLVFQKELAEIKREGVRVICIGERERFSKDLQEMMDKAEKETEGGNGVTLVLALSYGGRAEVVAAARALARAALAPAEVTERVFEKFLWTAGLPDPDLIIRTGGEQRLSGFLPWQSVYSELFFTNTFWPDFGREEFNEILAAFARRERRHGK